MGLQHFRLPRKLYPKAFCTLTARGGGGGVSVRLCLSAGTERLQWWCGLCLRRCAEQSWCSYETAERNLEWFHAAAYQIATSTCPGDHRPSRQTTSELESKKSVSVMQDDAGLTSDLFRDVSNAWSASHSAVLNTGATSNPGSIMIVLMKCHSGFIYASLGVLSAS